MKNISSPGSTAFFKAVFAWVLLGLIGTSSLRAQNTPLNDSNFFTARDLWFSDQSSAFATYGHIKDWNVTGVTNMSNAFKSKATFDENITGWDVSNVTIMYGMFWGAASFNQPIGTNMRRTCFTLPMLLCSRTPLEIGIRQPSTNPLAIGMLAKSPT